MSRRPPLIRAILLHLAFAAAAMADLTPYAYRHLGPWTDREPDRLRQLDLFETDLGVSFPYRPRNGPAHLVFLFGDTHPFSAGPDEGRWDEDVLARAPLD